ncbi:MAG: hypothetical protein AAEI92_12475 [Arenicellales bacterium]
MPEISWVTRLMPRSRSVFRIGHMGHLNPPMLLGALATIDTAFKALDFSHGNGAVEAAASVLASSG